MKHNIKLKLAEWVKANEYQCGCYVYRDQPSAQPRFIDYCTIHRAAPEMLEALKKIAVAPVGETTWQTTMRKISWIANEAIAKAGQA